MLHKTKANFLLNVAHPMKTFKVTDCRLGFTLTGLDMVAVRINEQLYMVDVEVAGQKGFIASYVLKGEKAIIVEAGPISSVQNLIHGLEELNIKADEVAYVAVSHIHLDHAGGVGPLLRCFPKAKVVVHERGAAHLANPDKLWQQAQVELGPLADIYGKPEPVPLDRILVAKDGMILDAGSGARLKVIETVGHASHHLSYYEPLSNGVFTGDSAGIYLSKINVVVPTTPSPFRLNLALTSIEKMVDLKPSKLYYTHFGVSGNAVERLMAYAGQLKLWARVAKETLEKGESLKFMRQKIIEYDMATRIALEHVKANQVFNEESLLRSMSGVLDYVKNYGLNIIGI
jgi:glyoxylase-like metal-dependent hydrolase (beta-lactamase superfamily II)